MLLTNPNEVCITVQVIFFNIKSNVYIYFTFKDIRQFTKIIIKLSDFKLLCVASETEILNAKEPLSIFFASCGKLYESASNDERKQIADHLQSALTGFEKWIPISESPPAIFKIHIVIALIIFNCAPIVYVRVSSIDFFFILFIESTLCNCKL